MSSMDISPLKYEDISKLDLLQPAGWNDIRKVFYTHHGKPYFESFKGMINKRLVAVGHNIYCAASAWVGNIIVSESYRNQGLGQNITQYLIHQIKNRGIKNIYLLATDLGRVLYGKMGFTEMARFSFIKFRPSKVEIDKSYFIRKIHKTDFHSIIEMDKMATGEDRSMILQYFLDDGWVVSQKKSDIKGFYLSELGDGLIIARNEGSGIELSKIRYQEGKQYVVVPNVNTEFLRKAGIEYTIQPRIAYYMYLGSWKNWNPKMIYSRVGGYLG